jgi:hypothetical protein
MVNAMDLMTLPGMLRSRLWLILAVAVLVTTAAALTLRPGKLAYQTQVRVQLTTPQQDEINLLDQYRSTDVRDEASLARNNFLVVLKSADVAQRTATGLQLSGDDATYRVDARPIRDTNFLDVDVRATSPQLAVEIANAHVNESIRRFGELRAKPAAATKDLLGQALQNAERQRAGVTATAVPQDGRPAPPGAYDLLLKKYAEATLAAESAQHVSYIQVIDPASEAVHVATTRRFGMTLGLAALGGLGLGVVLAVLLESGRRTRITVQPSPDVDIHFDFRDQPIVSPDPRRVALREPFDLDDFVEAERVHVSYQVDRPSLSYPREPERERVERTLELARRVLWRAERELDAAEVERLGPVLKAMRGIAFDQQRALDEGADPEEVCGTLRKSVEGVVELVAMADGEVARALLADAGGEADLEALVDEAMFDRDAADRLIARASSPLTAVRAMSVLAEAAGAGSPAPAPIAIGAHGLASGGRWGERAA